MKEVSVDSRSGEYVDKNGTVRRFRSPEEKEELIAAVKELMRQGYTEEVACTQLGLSVSTYKSWVYYPSVPHQDTLSYRNLSEINPEDRDDLSKQARLLYGQGKTISEIMPLLKLTRATLTNLIYKERKNMPAVTRKKVSLSQPLIETAQNSALTKKTPITIEVNTPEVKPDPTAENLPFVLMIGTRKDMKEALENLSRMFTQKKEE